MVEWKKLGEVCEVLRGKRLTKSQLSESEGYPVLHGGSSPMGFYKEYNRKANTTVVVNTGNAGSVFFYDKPFWSSDACYSLYPNNNILDKFLYLYVYGCEPILKGKIRAGAMPTIDANAIKMLEIPIPSLEEQNRIVGILDIFTDSIENLKQQIAQRRKQFEFYRDQLLDLEGKEGVEMKLQDIAQYRRGSFPQPYGNREWYDGEGAMPFVQVADVEESGMRLKKKTKQFISQLAMPKSVFVPKGTVIVTLQGSIGKVAINQYDVYVDRTLAIFEKFIIEMNKKYFAYQLERIFSIKKEKARGGTIKTITKEEFSAFVIPVPPLSEQSRIVSILDTFEASISNLEAQLEQRQKQYEYYRNQLLTFE